MTMDLDGHMAEAHVRQGARMARVPWGRPALPPFVAGAEYLWSGRRVRGREAIACDAEGALDAAARTGTLVRGGRRLLLLHQVHDE
jgi:hypothetical protein